MAKLTAKQVAEINAKTATPAKAAKAKPDAKAAKTAAITGVPTEASKAKAVAAAKGPKAGSARANQTAKYTEEAKPAKAKANPDKIVSVKGTTSGPDHVVVVAGETITIPRSKFVADLSKLAVVGGSLKAVQAYIATHKPSARLANGITGRDAPHSAKAAVDSNGKPVAAKAAPAAPAASRKAASAPKAKLGDASAITVVAKANPYKAGTKAAATFDLFAKAGTVGGFKALVAKNPSAYDAGYIRYSSRDGHITIG